MFTIWRFANVGGNNFKERLIIKGFKTSDAMYRFAQEQGNLWQYCDGPNARHTNFANMKPGTYAMAGGYYHNVKSLDASILAHV